MNADRKLHHSSWNDTQNEHGCGRWVGCFQNTFDKNWSVVDHEAFEEQIGGHHHEIESTKDKNAVIDLEKAFSLEPLDQPQQGKAENEAEGDQTEPIGDGIQGHMNPGEMMEKAVDRG